MKKLYIWIIIATLIVPIAFSYTPNSTGVISQNDELRLSIEKYDPSPVQPGEYFDLWLKAQLRYSKSLNRELPNLRIELEENFPFKIDPRDEKLKEFGRIKEGQIVIFKFKIKVSLDAIEGSNDIKFKYYTSDSSRSIKLPPLDIDIGSRDAQLLIDNIETTPERLSAGAPAKIKFILSNPTNSLFKNIDLKLDLFSTPFTALKSIPERKIYSLAPGQETELEFDIITDTDAPSKVYKVPIEFKYEDRLGKRYRQNNSIALLVNSPIDLQVDLESTEILRSGTSGEILFNIANKGTSNIKFLSVKAEPSDEYEIITSDRLYIGNVESDDFETVEFKYYINPTRKKEISLNLFIEYKTAFNEERNKIVSVPLKLYSKREAINYGLAQPSTKLRTLLLFLLIIALVYKLYRNFRKTKSIRKAFYLTYKGVILLIRNIFAHIINFFIRKKKK